MAFGAKIRLQVDPNKGKQEFQKQIQQYVDNSTASKPIYLHNIKTTNKAKEGLIRDLKDYLKNTTNIVLKVNKIDATSAISTFKKQLETMLSGLSITGLKEFLGTEGVENVYNKAAASAEKYAEALDKATTKKAKLNGLQMELNNNRSMLSSVFKDIGKIGVGDPEQFDALLAKYRELGTRIEKVKIDGKSKTRATVAGITEETMALQRQTTAILAKAEAEKVAAKNAEKNSAITKEIQNAQSLLKSSYKNFGKVNDSTQFDGLLTKYRQLENLSQQLATSQEMRSTENVDLLSRETVALKQKTDAIIELQKIEEKERAQSEKATASADPTLKRLKDLESIARSSYKKMLTSSELFDGEQLESIRNQYAMISNGVAELQLNESRRTAASLNGIEAEVMAMQQKVAATMRADAEAQKAANAEIANNNKIISLKSKLQHWVIANSKAYVHYKDQIDNIFKQLNTGKNNDGNPLSAAELNLMNAQLKEFDTVARQAGISGSRLIDSFTKGVQKFTGWSIITRSVMAAYQLIKKTVTAVRDVDAAMTELKKVTNETELAYQNLFNTVASRTHLIGASLSDTIRATADFARLGYTMDESVDLAEAALVYKNVGDGIDDVSVATESLISTIKAFGIEAEDSMSIIDKFNEVGNNFAISSAGIGEALQRSASALSLANNTIEESIALATGMNAVIQNPESVGTALKTMSMYLRAAKAEAEDAGMSTEGMAKSVSKLREELLLLTGNRIDIMVDDQTFKSTYQIMKELSVVWDRLSDINQAAILEKLGGKRNANAIASLITNFEDAERALSSAQNAEGSAMQENLKYLDSINGKLDILKSNFEVFAHDVLSSDLIKFIVDFGSGVFKVADGLQKWKLLLPTIVFIGAAIKSVKMYKAAQASENATTILASRMAIEAEKNSIDSLVASYWALSEAQRKETLTKLQNLYLSGEITKETYELITARLTLTTATEGAAKSNKDLAMSMKAVASSNPFGWVVLAISLLPTVFTCISKLIDVNEELIEQSDKIVDTYNDAGKTQKANIEAIKNIENEYYSLSKGVDENGKNVSLTASQYERYLDIVDQVVETSPEVCSGYDSEGRAIVNYTTLIKDAILEQEKYLSNQRSMYIGSGNDIFEGSLQKVRRATQYLNELILDAGYKYDGKSLRSLLLGGVNSGFDNPDDFRVLAQKRALEQLGIELGDDNNWDIGAMLFGKMGGGINKDVMDNLTLLYEKSSEFMVMLRNSGAYTEEELSAIQDRLHGLAGGITEYETAQKDQIKYLLEWSKDQDWYKNIPVGALDEFAFAMTKINDPFKSYNENTQAASKFGVEFSKALNSEQVKNIIELSKGLENGSVTITQYNQAIQGFKDSFEDGVLEDTLVNFFNSLYTAPTDKINAFERSLSSLSDTISELQDNYKLLDKAQKEMAENGSVSADTIAAIQKAMGEEENYLDYLIFENGEIKLNTELWKERAASTILGDIDGISKETDALVGQNQEIKNSIQEIIDTAKNSNGVKEFANNLKDAADNYNKLTNGNVDYNKRPIITKEQMQRLYPEFDGDYATTYDQGYYIADSKGEAHAIVITPILDNGEVLSQEALDDYVYNVLSGSDNILKADNLGIVIHAETTSDSKFWKTDSSGNWSFDFEAFNNMLQPYKDVHLENFLKLFTEDDLNNISEANSQISENTQKIKENNKELELREAIYEEIASDSFNVFNFDNLNSGLDGVKNSVSSIVSAMNDLANGTALTKKELIALALEYPNLLTASNLFTDGSIEGQQAMLQNMLEVYEKEYDAHIDTKIAELQATKEALQSRIDAESDKLVILRQIETSSAEGQREWLMGRIAEFNHLEEENYVTHQNGMLHITEDALTKNIEAQQDAAREATEKVWAPQSVVISESFAKGGSKGLEALEVVRSRVFGFVTNVKNKFINLGKHIAAAIAGKEYVGDDDSSNSPIDTDVTVTPPDIKLEGDGNITIGGRSVDEWVSEQKDYTVKRIEDMQKSIKDIDVSIENLQKLKGLSLMDIYGGEDDKKGKGSKTDEYIADIDAYYKALKRLAKAQQEVADLSKLIKNTEDLPTKINLERQLVDAYQEQADAEKHLMGLKRDTITQNASALRGLGFDVEYDRDKNELLINNLEHINELTATSVGKYKDMQEATNELRKSTEDLIDVTEDLNKDNIKSVETIEDVGYAIKGSKENILGYINEMVNNSNSRLSEVTGVFNTLHSAMESYNDSGFLTVDMFQSILGLGTKYLSLLYDESGAIRFNEQTLNDLIRAKIDDLAVTQAMALVDTVQEHKDDAEALRELANASYSTSEATWSLVYAKLAMLDLDEGLKASFAHQIDMIRQLAEAAKMGVGKESGERKKQLDEAKNALDYILEKTKELIRYETEQQIEALKKQVDEYKKIIDLKKKSIDASREEDNYQKSISEKVTEISELQAKADLLALDDSRSAQAERQNLLDEIASKQSELDDLQSDHSVEAQKNALDKMAADYEEAKQKEILQLQDKISSEEKVYQLAIERIKTQWSTLYGDLINWNTQAGNVINDEITKNWDIACEAVRKYGSYLEAIIALERQAGAGGGAGGIGGSGSGFPFGNNAIAPSSKLPKPPTNGDLSAGAGQSENEESIVQYVNTTVEKELSRKLKKPILASTVNSALAGINIGAGLGNGTIRATENRYVTNTNTDSANVFSPKISVNIGNEVGDKNNAKKYGQEIADIAIKSMYAGFGRRGISSNHGASFRP